MFLHLIIIIIIMRSSIVLMSRTLRLLALQYHYPGFSMATTTLPWHSLLSTFVKNIQSIFHISKIVHDVSGCTIWLPIIYSSIPFINQDHRIFFTPSTSPISFISTPKSISGPPVPNLNISSSTPVHFLTGNYPTLDHRNQRAMYRNAYCVL